VRRVRHEPPPPPPPSASAPPSDAASAADVSVQYEGDEELESSPEIMVMGGEGEDEGEQGPQIHFVPSEGLTPDLLEAFDDFFTTVRKDGR
jgi:hypothetical protein